MSNFGTPPTSTSSTSPQLERLHQRKAPLEGVDSKKLQEQLERLVEYSNHLETLMSSQQKAFQTQLSSAQLEAESLRKELKSTKEYYQATNQDIRLRTHVEENLSSQEILLLNQKLQESYGVVHRLRKRVLKYKHRKQKEKGIKKKSLETSKTAPRSRPYSFIHFEHENPGLPKQTRVECSSSQHINAIDDKSAQPYTPIQTVLERTSACTSGISSSFKSSLQPVVTEHQAKSTKAGPCLISTFSCPDIQVKGRSPYIKWTSEEDSLLRKAVNHFGSTNWQQISKEVPGRSYHQCRQRWLKVLKNSVNQETYKIDSSKVHIALNSLLPPNTYNSHIHSGAVTMQHNNTSSRDDLSSHDIALRASNDFGTNQTTSAIPSTSMVQPRKDSCPLWWILDH